MTTGERIEQLAKDRNMSLHKLATLAGVSYNTVYSAVKRKSDRLDRKNVEKIAAALEVPLSDLMGYEIKDLDDCSFATIDGDIIDAEIAKQLGYSHPNGHYLSILLKDEDDKKDFIHLLCNGTVSNEEAKHLLSIFQQLNFAGRRMLLSTAKNLLKYCAIDGNPQSEE